MDQLALLEVPPAPPAKRPRRPRIRPEVLQAVLQAVRAARAGHGHGLSPDELTQLAQWANRFCVWMADHDQRRPRTTSVGVWRLSRLAHWAAIQDLYLEGCTAAELQAWCLRLARWSEGQ